MSNEADWTTRDRWGVPLAARRPLAESLARAASQDTREAARWARMEGK